MQRRGFGGDEKRLGRQRVDVRWNIDRRASAKKKKGK
jgi:hypothetical protein